ncbi:MAG: ABC-2 family transporter protein [Acidimicrobiia bacterium]
MASSTVVVVLGAEVVVGAVVVVSVPLAFAVTVPAEVVASRFDGSSLVWSLVITAGFALGTRLIWKRGIRNYAGASA